MHSSKLRRDYDLLLQAPFPSGSAIDELDAMHAELAYADSMIADSAIPFFTGRRYGGVPDQVIRELDHVILAAGKLQESEVHEIARLAASYKKYAELLMTVYQGIENAHSRGS
jgi:hypothetical protein